MKASEYKQIGRLLHNFSIDLYKGLDNRQKIAFHTYLDRATAIDRRYVYYQIAKIKYPKKIFIQNLDFEIRFGWGHGSVTITKNSVEIKERRSIFRGYTKSIWGVIRFLKSVGYIETDKKPELVRNQTYEILNCIRKYHQWRFEDYELNKINLIVAVNDISL